MGKDNMGEIMNALNRNIGKKDKKLIILRGLPGSGKSETAKRLVGNGIIHSTDDFFIIDGVYVFDESNVSKFHYFNFLNSIRSMQRGLSPIIIDNTNIVASDCVDYVELGSAYGYEIIIVEPSADWAFDIEELMKRNTHCVPRETMVDMLEKYEKPEVFKKKLGL
jgi:predicted kinase